MEFLTVFQKTTLALAIVFSILTLAIVFYSLMHTTKYKSPFVKVLFTIIIPMITFIMWFACLFAGVGILNSNELYIFLISIVCGAGLMGIAYGIAYLIYYLIKRKNSNFDETSEEVENQIDEPVNQEEAIEQTIEENDEDLNDDASEDNNQKIEETEKNNSNKEIVENNNQEVNEVKNEEEN